MARLLLGIFILGSLFTVSSLAAELRGSVAFEQRSFPSSPAAPAQHDVYSSFVLEPEFYFGDSSGRHSLTFSPYYRQDSHDEERTHADVRELYWLMVGDWYEISAGVRRVFWGTTESQHLVDVINQTDLVENPDAEDKLGQPMASAKLLTGGGAFEFYLLPGFRERTFPASDGRWHPFPGRTIGAQALYEDHRKDRHLDWAVRWSTTLGNWDIGVSHFEGTSRDPLLVSEPATGTDATLSPYYELMQQTALDIQGVVGPWLWKAEAIHRDSRLARLDALTAGLEYTFYQARGSSLDIGVVAEYLYGDQGGTGAPVFEDDLMIGMRLNTNNVQGTQFLLGVIRDRKEREAIYRLEAGHRLSDHWRLDLEAAIFSGFHGDSPLFGFRKDDFIQVELRYHF